MEIKKNKKRLNVLKAKTTLKTAMYFVLKIKAPKTTTILKSIIKYLPNNELPFDFKEIKYPVLMKAFENYKYLFEAAEQEKTNIVFISFKDIFLKTTQNLKILYVINNFNSLRFALCKDLYLAKILNKIS